MGSPLYLGIHTPILVVLIASWRTCENSGVCCLTSASPRSEGDQLQQWPDSGQPFPQHRLSFLSISAQFLQLQDPQLGQDEAGGEKFGDEGAHIPSVGRCQETEATKVVADGLQGTVGRDGAAQNLDPLQEAVDVTHRSERVSAAAEVPQVEVWKVGMRPSTSCPGVAAHPRPPYLASVSPRYHSCVSPVKKGNQKGSPFR